MQLDILARKKSRNFLISILSGERLSIFRKFPELKVVTRGVGMPANGSSSLREVLGLASGDGCTSL